MTGAKQHFLFGPRALFGSHVTATGTSPPSAVAVLCYPFGQEYTLTHRAFRQIAVLLSRRGIPSLRFDYSGTGDSPGCGCEASYEDWVEDARAAIDEARQRSGATRIHLMGLRLGAAIAATASIGAQVDRLVLWDPVVRGRAYLDELGAVRLENGDATWWVDGFPLTELQRSEIEQVDLRSLPLTSTARVVQVVSHDDDDFRALAETLESGPGQVETRLIPGRWDWKSGGDAGGIILPHDMIRSVVDALAV